MTLRAWLFAAVAGIAFARDGKYDWSWGSTCLFGKYMDTATVYKVKETPKALYMWGTYPSDASVLDEYSRINYLFVFSDERSKPASTGLLSGLFADDSNRPDDITDFLDAFCQQNNYVTWTAVVDSLDDLQLDEEGNEIDESVQWYPSFCRLPEKAPKFAKEDICELPQPTPDSLCFPGAYVVLAPEILYNDYDVNSGKYFLWKTQIKYTDSEGNREPNLVCTDNHHFSGQPAYSGPWIATPADSLYENQKQAVFERLFEGRVLEERQLEAFNDVMFGESEPVVPKLGQGIIPDPILEYFYEGVEPCELIRHACHCKHAPPEWNCRYCATPMGPYPLCYREGSSTAQWCTAVSAIITGADQILEPVQPEQYEIMKHNREAYPNVIWID